MRVALLLVATLVATCHAEIAVRKFSLTKASNMTTTLKATSQPTDSGTPFADLRKALLDGYDPQARPGTPAEPIVVEMGLMVNSLKIEEWESALHANAFVLMSWTDERLAWDPASYSGIETIKLSPLTVWKPDIELFNSIPSFTSALQALAYNVLVMSNGTVLWVPSVSMRAACQLVLIKFPQDRQRCSLIFGSWTYDKSEIDIKLIDKPISNDYLWTESTWHLAFSYARIRDEVYPGIPGTWPQARFVFYLHRRVTPYCISLYTPVFACVMASIASFLVWRRLCGTVLVIITLLKTAVLSSVVMYHGLSLRASACGVPCVMKFIGSLIALEALMVPLKAIFANMVAGEKGDSEKSAEPLPRSLLVFVNATALFRKKTKGGDEACLLSSELEKKNVEDWARARFVLGMLVMGVYLCGLVVLSTTFLLPLMAPEDEIDTENPE